MSNFNNTGEVKEISILDMMTARSVSARPTS